MKYYSTKIIKEFLETYKGEIKSITLGMREDWSWTAESFYAEPENDWDNSLSSLELNLSGEKISIAGITGSSWATPVMKYCLKDGTSDIMNCYYDDMVTYDEAQIAFQKAFARITGGMDSV